MRFARWLFLAGAAAALFACFDFYFQLPTPAGYGAQFIWVGEGVLRRAQGLFYEASTLGNFCAFFLVMIAVALVRTAAPSASSAKLTVYSKPVLLGGAAALSAALIFSYSRASVL